MWAGNILLFEEYLALLALSTTACCVSLTYPFLRLLRQNELMDRPNRRSSHSRPTPTGGGVIVVLMTSSWAVMGLVLTQKTVPYEATILLAAFCLLALFGFLDDLKAQPAGFRLLLQCGCVLPCLTVLGPGLSITGGRLPVPVEFALVAVIWVGFINLYNFMDGIDGLASVETVAVGLGLVVLLLLNDAHSYALIAAAMVGSALGFLGWNWSPARIFLGDAGSVPLGFLLGALLLYVAAQGMWASALILPGYFLADAGLTLLRRIVTGEKFWQAHNRHFYQRAHQRGVSHARISKIVALVNLGLLLLAVLAVYFPWPSLLLALALVLSLLRWMATR